MLKKSLFVLFVLLSGCAFSAEKDFSISVNKPWKTSEKETYSLDFKGKGYPFLMLEKALTPRTWYRLEWTMKNSAEDLGQAVGINFMTGVRKVVFSVPLFTGETQYRIPFYSGENPSVKIKLFRRPTSAGRIEIGKFRFFAMTAADFKENQFVNGDFEKTGIYTPLQFGSFAAVKPNDLFLAGENSLEILAKKGNGLVSLPLAVRPGKKYLLKIQGAAEGSVGVSFAIDSWSPFGHRGKHFCPIKTFHFQKVAQEFSMPFQLPENRNDYPDLKDGIFRLRISFRNVEPVKVFLDALSFRELPE